LVEWILWRNNNAEKKTMFKTSSVFTLVLFVMSLSRAAITSTGGKVIEVTKLDQINTALKKGTVFLSLVLRFPNKSIICWKIR
jgi:hypothetical protein